MAYDYYDLLAEAGLWAEKLVAAGRLNKDSAQPLLDIEHQGADRLFEQPASASRPLLVAFMGGTGVGKSSLLNRLAGSPIASAGMQRPTSREVTLYHHRSVAMLPLPEGLSPDHIKIGQHDDIQNKDIVWLDMPDLDSIEQSNQRLVLQWLPQIDVLLYVVSPERYRDNKAWELLLAEGLKHAWLFVMNQWDRGQAVQYEDFKRQLFQAGFENPLVFRTSCVEPEGDEFAELLMQLKQLAGQHNRLQLEQRHQHIKLQQLQQVMQTILTELKSRNFQQLQQFYADIWQHFESSLQQGSAWPLQQLSILLAEQPGKKSDFQLWDEWAQSRFDDLLDEVILQAVQNNIPCQPLKTGLQGIKQQAEKKILYCLDLAGREALLKPGNALQRFLSRLSAVLEILLPLVAMCLVGYQVFWGYYLSAAETKAYLGVDFAIHSTLLIGLCWLMPYFLHKKIQPSLQKTALKGLQKGLEQGLLALDADIKALLTTEQKINEVLQQELAALLPNMSAEPVITIEKDSLLGRVLLND